MALPASRRRGIRHGQTKGDILAHLCHRKGNGLHVGEDSVDPSIRRFHGATVHPPTHPGDPGIVSARRICFNRYSSTDTLCSVYIGFIEFAIIVGDMHVQLFSASAKRQSQQTRNENAKAFSARLNRVNGFLKEKVRGDETHSNMPDDATS